MTTEADTLAKLSDERRVREREAGSLLLLYFFSCFWEREREKAENSSEKDRKKVKKYLSEDDEGYIREKGTLFIF